MRCFFYTLSSENDRKMKQIMISSDLVWLPWQHYICNMNFKQGFLNNNVLPFICIKSNIKITVTRLRLGLHSATKSYSMQKGLLFKMGYVCKFPQGDDQGLFQQHAISLQKSFY